MDTIFARFEAARLLSLGYLARTCLRKKAWTVYESQRSSECYQKQMAWRRWPDSQKSYIAMEKAFSSCGKAEWRNYSAHFLLIRWLIRITVTFWCSLRTANNINDEVLVNIVLWHVTLFPLYNGYYGSVLGEIIWTHSKMFAHYIHAFLLIHFTCSVA